MYNKTNNQIQDLDRYDDIKTKEQFLCIDKIYYYNRIFLIHYLRIGDIDNVIKIKKNINISDDDQVITFFVQKLILDCLKNDNIDDVIKIKKEFNLKYNNIIKYTDIKYKLQSIINTYLNKGDIETVKKISDEFKNE